MLCVCEWEAVLGEGIGGRGLICHRNSYHRNSEKSEIMGFLFLKYLTLTKRNTEGVWRKVVRL